MKIRRLSFCLAVALASLLVGPSPAHAQGESNFYIAPWIAAAFLSGNVGLEVGPIVQSELNDAPAFGLFLGGHLKNFMVEAVFSTAFSSYSTPLGEIDVGGTPVDVATFSRVTELVYGLNVGYAFSTSKTSVSPYLSVGAGGISFNPEQSAKDLGAANETSFMFNFGAGLEVPMTDTVFFRFDLRDYISGVKGDFTIFSAADVQDKSTVHTIMLAAGVSFRTS